MRKRLRVFRSNKHIFAQIIDDDAGRTLAAASDLKVKKGTKTERAREAGRLLAEASLKVGVKEVFFDRGRRRYHGRVQALAEGARGGGLVF